MSDSHISTHQRPQGYVSRRQTKINRVKSLYKSKRWQQLRWATFERDEFKCKACGCHVHRGRSHPQAAVCDHIKAHRGDASLFHDPANLQTLCKTCHDGWKQRQETGSGTQSIDATGWPDD